jgi:hypothetical protein
MTTKNQLRTVPLVFVALAMPSTGFAQAAPGGGSVLAPLIEAVMPAIIASFGSSSVAMTLHKYRHTVTTTYRDIFTSNDWTLLTLPDKQVSYWRLNYRMGPGYENFQSDSSSAPFTISMGGSAGDIPFGMRRQKCSMPYTKPDGSQGTYSVDVISDVTFKFEHKYVQKPWFPSGDLDVNINCINWVNERESCVDRPGFSDKSFLRKIATSGASYASIPGSEVVNLSHGPNSGLGIIW